MRYGWVITCIVLSAALTGCADSSADTRDADVMAIKETEAAWVKDAATKDVDKWAQHYTDDGSVLLPDMPIMTGKEAIRGGMKPMMSDPNFAVAFGATKLEVAKSGELAYSQGIYSLTTSNPKTKAPTTEKGKYLTVYKKQADGSWKAVEDTFMADGPPAADPGK